MVTIQNRSSPGLSRATSREVCGEAKSVFSISYILYRAALSIPLNIAEGAGRYSKPDKRNFYTIARGSVFECTAIIDILYEKGALSKEQYEAPILPGFQGA